MLKKLNEIFFLPIFLKVVIKIDGDKYYGSDRLNNSILKLFKKNPRTKASYNSFYKMINKKELIPCFFNKKMFKFIQWRIFKSYPEEVVVYDYEEKEFVKTKIDNLANAHSVMGFYTPIHKKIVLFLSNTNNIFSHTKNKYIIDLTIHELMHKSASEKSKQFYNLFENEFILFYKNLYSEIFKLNENIPDKNISNISKFIFSNEITANNKIELNKYHKVLKNNLSQYTNLEKNEFENILMFYINVVNTFDKNMSLFMSKQNKFKYILLPIYKSYKKTFGINNLDTIAIQELLYPSEIIAILSSYKNDPKINKAINFL